MNPARNRPERTKQQHRGLPWKLVQLSCCYQTVRVRYCCCTRYARRTVQERPWHVAFAVVIPLYSTAPVGTPSATEHEMNKRGAALVQGNAMAPRLDEQNTGSRRCVEQRPETETQFRIRSTWLPCHLQSHRIFPRGHCCCYRVSSTWY